ncbi:MAG: glycosyltransferase [Blastocatellia bacterium]
MLLKIAFLVNGDEHSAAAERANAFAARLADRYDIRVAYRSARKVISAIRFFVILVSAKPRLVYVFDMSYSGVLAGCLYKLATRARLIIDTGDAICELARSMGRSGIGIWLTRLLEALSLRSADRIVVRGTFHQQLLESRGIRAELIQDGVDTSKFKPTDVPDLRKEYGLDGFLTIGLVGSVVWNETLGMCYGSEVAEVVRLLKDAPMKGVVIGDGPGLPRLKEMCEAYGIETRMAFLGRIPYDDLPRYLNLIDVCISTQTNDAVGQVRTTGKLPLYLAAGRYVLATRVGEAALCLPDEMLIDYEGTRDHSYAQRLADRVRGLFSERQALMHGLELIEVARTRFDYSILADRLAVVIERTIAPDAFNEVGGPSNPGLLKKAVAILPISSSTHHSRREEGAVDETREPLVRR